MNKLFMIVGLGMFGMVSLRAQTPSAPPRPLYQSRPSPDMVCRETISYPGLEKLKSTNPEQLAGLPPMERIRAIEADKDTVKVSQGFTDGTSIIAYYRGGRALVENQKGNAEIHAVGSETWAEDFTKGFYPELSWVKAADYRGIKDWSGSPHHLYEGQDAVFGASRLYVRISDLLPACLESAGRKIVYAYEQTGGENIVLPEKLDTALSVLIKNSGNE